VLQLSILGGALVVIAVVAVTLITMNQSPARGPLNMASDGIKIGTDLKAVRPPGLAPSATPVPSEPSDPGVIDIRVYVDYLSSGARDWQLANVQQLSTWVNEGAVTLTYHPVSMLAAKSNGTKYSLRAASAAACMATHSPDDFFQFNNELLSRQPAIDSDGYSDAELADLAIASGADDPKKVRNCIEADDFTGWVKEGTERAVAGIPDTDDLALTGIPMILVNGEAYVGALDDPAEFSQFVMTSASDAFYKSQQTATPTPTPTP